MKISARNQLKGTIKNIQEGAVNGVVTICLGENTIKTDITMEAIKNLALTVGKEAYAIVLHTAPDRVARHSHRQKSPRTTSYSSDERHRRQ